MARARAAIAAAPLPEKRRRARCVDAWNRVGAVLDKSCSLVLDMADRPGRGNMGWVKEDDEGLWERIYGGESFDCVCTSDRTQKMSLDPTQSNKWNRTTGHLESIVIFHH